MNESTADFPLPVDIDEHDIPVPAPEAEVPIHLALEFATDTVAEAITVPEEPVASPTERTKLDKYIRRQQIHMAAAAITQARRHHFTYSLAVHVPPKRPLR